MNRRERFTRHITPHWKSLIFQRYLFVRPENSPRRVSSMPCLRCKYNITCMWTNWRWLYSVWTFRKFPSNMTSKDIERLIPLLLGFTFPTSLGNRDMRPLDEVLTYNELSPSDVLKLLLPKCDKFLIKCKWEGNTLPCKELFKRAKTKDGYCCSFNYNTEYNKWV